MYDDDGLYEDYIEPESTPFCDDCLTCAFWVDNIESCTIGESMCAEAIKEAGLQEYQID